MRNVVGLSAVVLMCVVLSSCSGNRTKRAFVGTWKGSVEDEEIAAGAADLHRGVAEPAQEMAVVEKLADVLEQVEALRRVVSDPLQRVHGVFHPVGTDAQETVDAVPDRHRQGGRFGGVAEALEQALLALLLHAHQNGQRVGGREGGADLVVGGSH